MCYNRRAHVQSDHLLEKHLLSVYICSRDGCWGNCCPAGGRGGAGKEACSMDLYAALLCTTLCMLYSAEISWIKQSTSSIVWKMNFFHYNWRPWVGRVIACPSRQGHERPTKGWSDFLRKKIFLEAEPKERAERGQGGDHLRSKPPWRTKRTMQN